MAIIQLQIFAEALCSLLLETVFVSTLDYLPHTTLFHVSEVSTVAEHFNLFSDT
jgi:hypothetical protein